MKCITIYSSVGNNNNSNSTKNTNKNNNTRPLLQTNYHLTLSIHVYCVQLLTKLKYNKYLISSLFGKLLDIINLSAICWIL